MRVLACSFLISFWLCAQNREASKLLPIPGGMEKTWPAAVLSLREKKLLQEAVEPDLRDLQKHCGEKSKFDNLAKTNITLGTLGKGVIVSTHGSCACGAAGNCAIYLYVRENERYREVLRDGKRVPYSWAFAMVDSKSGVPDLVLASNERAFQVTLTKYTYLGHKFVPMACETLTAKNSDSGPANWWNPSEVVVKPCETH